MKTYSVEEAAQIIGVHQDTIRKALRSNELKAAKLGGVYRISHQDLSEWYRSKGGETFSKTNDYYAVCSRCGLEWDCEPFKPRHQYVSDPYRCPSNEAYLKTGKPPCGLVNGKMLPALNLQNEMIFYEDRMVILLVERDEERPAFEIVHEMKEHKIWPNRLNKNLTMWIRKMKKDPRFYRVRVEKGIDWAFLICVAYNIDSSKKFVGVEHYQLAFSFDEKFKFPYTRQATFQEELRISDRAVSIFEGDRDLEKAHIEGKLKEAYGLEASIAIVEFEAEQQTL